MYVPLDNLLGYDIAVIYVPILVKYYLYAK